MLDTYSVRKMNFVLEENGQVLMVDEQHEVVVEEVSPRSPTNMTELAPIKVNKQRRKEPLKIRPMSEVELSFEVVEPPSDKAQSIRSYRSRKLNPPVIKEKVEKVKKDKKDSKTVAEFKEISKESKDEQKMDVDEVEEQINIDKDNFRRPRETTRKEKELPRRERPSTRKSDSATDNKDTSRTVVAEDKTKKPVVKRKKRKKRKSVKWT